MRFAMSRAPKTDQKKPSIGKDDGLDPNKAIKDEELSEAQLKAVHAKLDALRAADAAAEPDDEKERRSFRALIAYAACDFGVNDAMVTDLVKRHFGVADISELHEGCRDALNRFLGNLDIRKFIN
jgi:hypothetical protein